MLEDPIYPLDRVAGQKIQTRSNLPLLRSTERELLTDRAAHPSVDRKRVDQSRPVACLKNHPVSSADRQFLQAFQHLAEHHPFYPYRPLVSPPFSHESSDFIHSITFKPTSLNTFLTTSMYNFLSLEGQINYHGLTPMVFCCCWLRQSSCA